MDSNNQSYWFIRLEDQNNVLGSNNFTMQSPQIPGPEPRYIISTGESRQYVHINETPAPDTELQPAVCNIENAKESSDENLWDRNRVRLFLTLCLENGINHSTVSSSKEKIIWHEIANLIGTTFEECNRKFKNLQRTYVRLLKKKKLGKHVKWVLYDLCKEVFKDSKQLTDAALEAWEEGKVQSLLLLYIENLNRFRNHDCLQKEIWKDIAVALGSTQNNCYNKFRNLKKTYITLLERSRATGKLIRWPYLQYFEKIYYNQDPNAGPWDRNKVKLLLDAYSKIAYRFRNPKYQKKELWKEISAVVGESPDSCDKKFRNLKQTYLRLKTKTGENNTKWRYYQDFERIYSRAPCINRISNSGDPMTHNQGQPGQEDYIIQLLTFYVENKEKFKDPLVRKNHLWKVIGTQLGMSADDCNRKFRNLKQTYLRLMTDMQHHTGRKIRWPYFPFFEKIYGDLNLLQKNKEKGNISTEALSEIKRVVQDLHKTQESDRNFERLMSAVQEANSIQRERNTILLALLNKT